MNSFVKLSFVSLMLFSLWACTTKLPPISPGVEIKPPVQQKAKNVYPKQVQNKFELGVIGEVEPVYFNPIATPFASRIDTGAETSSVDAKNVKFFERDGEKWVSFDIINRVGGEKHSFEKPLVRIQNIKRIGGDEQRAVVVLKVRIGDKVLNTEFSLADREKFDYQGLIGRNILTGRAVVDTSIKNSLY